MFNLIPSGKQNHQHRLNWKWSRPIENDGNVHSILMDHHLNEITLCSWFLAVGELSPCSREHSGLLTGDRMVAGSSLTAGVVIMLCP